MTNTSATRPTLVLTVAVIATALYAALLWFELGATRDSLEATQAREARLLEQLQSIATMQQARPGGSAPALDPQVKRAFERAGIEDPLEAARIAVVQRPDLIEHEPELGGTFFFLEDSVEILSDRYLYAAFEDGHVMGHALLRYALTADGGLELELIDSYRH